ncbi:MAG: hypothetical protein IPL32_07165 [Chloracidobacterium sp.]|nr:hypothetical protein [Chloracidobacterium sp.]
MGLSQKYKKSLDEKWCMRFKTLHPDGDAYDGIVLHLSNELIALGEMRDFEFDGINVFPRNAIKGYRDNKFDRCCNQILFGNGQLKRLRVAKWLNACETFNQLALVLMKRDIWPAVEVVFKDGDRALYVGPIVEVKNKHFSINCYDAAGKWEKVYRLKFNEVFRFEFGSKYTNHFNNYMRQKEVSGQ